MNKTRLTQSNMSQNNTKQTKKPGKPINLKPLPYHNPTIMKEGEKKRKN